MNSRNSNVIERRTMSHDGDDEEGSRNLMREYQMTRIADVKSHGQ
jgi:hypothetical protein